MSGRTYRVHFGRRGYDNSGDGFMPDESEWALDLERTCVTNEKADPFGSASL